MLFLSWQKWPDLLIDFGRELYVPWQISQGQVLYKDIAYLYGPLSQYLHAFIFKIFGIHLLSLAIFNIGLILILTWIIYRIFLATTDWTTAILTSGTFLGAFAFAQYVMTGNYNFVCPYTYNLTHGIFLSFLCIYSYLTYLNTRQNKFLLLIGILLGLIFLTKVEVFVAIILAMFFGISLAIYFDQRKWLEAVKMGGMVSAGFFLPVILFVLYLSSAMPLNQVAKEILHTFLFNPSITSISFYRRILGVDQLSKNLWALAIGTIQYLALFLDLILIRYCARRMSRHNSIFFEIPIISGLLFFFSICFVIFTSWTNILRPLPIVILILGIYLFALLWPQRKNLKSANPLLAFLTMLVFAFILLLKMGLNVHAYHYGFALAMPATLILVAALVHFVPLIIEKEDPADSWPRLLGIILVGIFLISSLTASTKTYRLKTHSVESMGDVLYDFNPKVKHRVLETKAAIKKLKEIMKPNETFVVFPEGIMLNYLTRTINPTPYVNFMPTELEFFGQEKILNSFIKTSPDYVVIIDKNLAEYGCAISQKSCGGDLLTWISKNYFPVSRVGQKPFSKKGFGIVILKRISVSPEAPSIP